MCSVSTKDKLSQRQQPVAMGLKKTPLIGRLGLILSCLSMHTVIIIVK